MAKTSGTLAASTNVQVLPKDLTRQTITIFNHSTNHPLYAEFDGVASVVGVKKTIDWDDTYTLASTAHGLLNGEQVFLTTTDTLPAPLQLNTTYYVVNKQTDTFELSLTYGGPSIEITSGGNGTNSVNTYGGWCINHDDNSLTLSVRDFPEIRGAVNLRAANEIVYSVRTA